MIIRRTNIDVTGSFVLDSGYLLHAGWFFCSMNCYWKYLKLGLPSQLHHAEINKTPAYNEDNLQKLQEGVMLISGQIVEIVEMCILPHLLLKVCQDEVKVVVVVCQNISFAHASTCYRIKCTRHALCPHR